MLELGLVTLWTTRRLGGSVPLRLLRRAGAGHVGAQDARPREYERRVTGFFDQALREEQP